MSAAPPPGSPLSRRAALLALLAGLAAASPRAGRAQTPPPPARPVPPPRAPAPAAPAASPPRPGSPAPPEVVRELQAALASAIYRFERKDLEGVLAHVSDAYRTGPFTKPTVRTQLLTMFQVNQQLRARVRIDEVRLVGPHAWVWSTGDVAGQLPFVNQWLGLFTWARELEVARREGGVWRLYGYQQ